MKKVILLATIIAILETNTVISQAKWSCPTIKINSITENPYKTLGISQDSTKNEIKAAYKKLAKTEHPDKNPENKDYYQERFIQISEAKNLLLNESTKRRIDSCLTRLPVKNISVSNLPLSPLFSAIKNFDLASIKALIAQGADVNERCADINKRGEYFVGPNVTALIWAISKNNNDAAKLLIKAGADVNAKDDEGITALMKAYSNDNIKISELLIEAGADVNAQNNKGENALSLTRSGVTMALLTKHGAVDLGNNVWD